MSLFVFDTETECFEPGRMAPALVCVTYQRPCEPARILHHTDAEPVLRQALESKDVIVGQHVAYDLAVVVARYPHLRSLVFKAYAENRITDTKIREQLIDIARGTYRGRMVAKNVWVSHGYTLEDLAWRCAGIRIFKDGWRMSYGKFIDTPLDEWPRRAREVQAEARPRVAEITAILATEKDDATIKALTKERAGLIAMIEGDPDRASEYPLDDARATLAVYQAQEKHAAYLKDQFRQARAAWAMHLSSVWGLRTDAIGVEFLRSATQAAYDALEEEMIQLGFIRNNKKRTRDTKAAKARMIQICAEERVTLRRTDGHTKDSTKCKDAAGNRLPGGDDRCVEHVSLDMDACKAVEDPVMRTYAKVAEYKKVLSNDVEALAKGVYYPVHTSYGLAETGRTTSSRPPIQNLRKLPGVREAFVPRPGYVFFSADYPALELYTLAQCCVSWLGVSKLAEALNGGMDPHLGLAATLLQITYGEAEARLAAGDPEIADMRQLAKLGNFGFPGGMGVPKLIRSIQKQLGQLNPALLARLTQRGFLSVDRMKWLKEQWFATWPEMPHYFARVNKLCDTESGRGSAVTLFTERHRGDASYCALANNGFQALGSDCAKEAFWRICRAQYDDPTSGLWNSRTVAFVHDEFVGEALEAVAHEAATALADTMVEGANVYLPDVPIRRAKVKPSLMRRWSKDAKPVFGADGRLVPWAAKAA